MNAFVIAACAAVAALAVAPAAAHGYEMGDIRVRHPWTRATPAVAAVAAGYMEIRNSGGQIDRLVGASAPVAERVELHLTVRESDVMRMREILHLEVPARQRVTLRPGGAHLVIIGLKKPLARGDQVALPLRFERAGELQVMLEVQAADSNKQAKPLPRLTRYRVSKNGRTPSAWPTRSASRRASASRGYGPARTR